MNIVRLSGGIGNQLSQLSFIISQQRNGRIVKLDESFYFNRPNLTRVDKILNFKLEYASKEEIESFKIPQNVQYLSRFLIKSRMLLGLKILRRIHTGRFYFHQGRFNLFRHYWSEVDEVYFDGTFINRELISSSIEFMRELINKVSLPGSLQGLLEIMSSSNSVALHIRRGDYEHLVKSGFFTLSNNYYLKATEIIEKKITNPHYYLFSEYQLVNLNLLELKNYDFISVDEKHKDLLELILMSSCKNFIVANSSFSLWASYISDSQNKIVIGPKKWMKQHFAITDKILPKNSIVIKSY